MRDLIKAGARPSRDYFPTWSGRSVVRPWRGRRASGAMPGRSLRVSVAPARRDRTRTAAARGTPMHVLRRVLIWVLFVGFWVALTPPLFTHGACTAEFDAF